jgi:hypothetical protein
VGGGARQGIIAVVPAMRPATKIDLKCMTKSLDALE